MYAILKNLLVLVFYIGTLGLVGCFEKPMVSIPYGEIMGVYIRGDSAILERFEMKVGSKYTQEIYRDNQLVMHSKGTWWVEGPELVLNGLVLSKRTDDGELTINSTKRDNYRATWEEVDGIPKIILDMETPTVLTKIKSL
jgi:hypothetical protein